MHYLARRLILFIPSLLAASVVVFLIMRVMPGDVALAILGQQSAEGGTRFSVAQADALRQQLGLRDPLPVQYGRWVWSMVNGDFGGKSVRTGEKLGSIMSRRLPVTAQLAAYTVALSMLVGVPLGVAAALSQDHWPDYLVRCASIAGQSMPNFWIALLLLLVLLKLFNWSPPLGYMNLWQDPWRHLQMVIWPTIILAWRFSAYVTRVVRSTMLDVLRQDYIRTALSKGLGWRLVVGRHALRNALIPAITLAGLEIGTLLGGTVILENLFGLPGMGQGIVDAAQVRDFPVVQSLAMVLVLLMLGLNLLVDLTYSLIDPRIRLS